MFVRSINASIVLAVVLNAQNTKQWQPLFWFFHEKKNGVVVLPLFCPAQRTFFSDNCGDCTHLVWPETYLWARTSVEDTDSGGKEIEKPRVHSLVFRMSFVSVFFYWYFHTRFNLEFSCVLSVSFSLENGSFTPNLFPLFLSVSFSNRKWNIYYLLAVVDWLGFFTSMTITKDIQLINSVIIWLYLK